MLCNPPPPPPWWHGVPSPYDVPGAPVWWYCGPVSEGMVWEFLSETEDDPASPDINGHTYAEESVHDGDTWDGEVSSDDDF